MPGAAYPGGAYPGGEVWPLGHVKPVEPESPPGEVVDEELGGEHAVLGGPLSPLSPRGQAMLDSLWAPERSDPAAIAVMRAGASELDGVEDLMELVRQQAWPNRADDTYGLLAIHEKMLGLPVAPFEVPIPIRQAAVKSAVQSRRVGSAKNWERRLATLIRGAAWKYKRNHPGRGQITITVAYGVGTYTASEIKRLAERITPAHIEIIMEFGEGWLAGISRAGDAI